MANSIVRRVWAVVVPAGACALLVACDWFAGSAAQSGGTDGGTSSSVPPPSDSGVSLSDDAGASDAAQTALDGDATTESGADAGSLEGAASEASDDGGGTADGGCASCVNGCFAGACTAPLSSLGATSASAGGAAVTLVQTPPDSTSTGGGPVSHTNGVTITTTTQPGGESLAVTLNWGFDPGLATFTAVVMTRTTSTQGSDTWTGVIPAQAAGSEVLFFVSAKPAVGTTLYDPSTFQVAYAYAVN